MNILITGASGFIGRHILSACLKKGHAVTACVRDTSVLNLYFPTVKTIAVDFTRDHDPQIWLPRLYGIDVVINSVGIIREKDRLTFDNVHTRAACALFKACESGKVRKVIQLSALGADTSAFSDYHLSKKKADDYLSTLALDWTILMPSIVYGRGAKSMAFFTALAALPFTPLVAKGDQFIQPIHIDDLCNTVILILDSTKLSRQRLEVVGPDPITVRSLYQILKAALGMKRAMYISVPYQICLTGARWGELLGNTPMTRQAVQMLMKGNTGSATVFTHTTGITPRAFEQEIMIDPPLPADITYAKQYFLMPLLRVTMALLWITTGYLSVFIYPLAESFSMLARFGISGAMAPAALYGAAMIDVVLGIALLINYRVRQVALMQIIVMVVYSTLITIGMPELWLHPFGPITKNIPLMVSTLFLLTAPRK